MDQRVGRLEFGRPAEMGRRRVEPVLPEEGRPQQEMGVDRLRCPEQGRPEGQFGGGGISLVDPNPAQVDERGLRVQVVEGHQLQVGFRLRVTPLGEQVRDAGHAVDPAGLERVDLVGVRIGPAAVRGHAGQLAQHRGDRGGVAPSAVDLRLQRERRFAGRRAAAGPAEVGEAAGQVAPLQRQPAQAQVGPRLVGVVAEGPQELGFRLVEPALRQQQVGQE